MTLPPEALKKLFRSRLKRGSILRAPVHFQETTTTRWKYLVLLNQKHQDDDSLLFFLSSSQLAFYDKYPILKADAVFIEPGTINCFPLRTVVNCREVHTFQKADIENLVVQRRIEVVGDMSPELMTRIDRIISESKLINSADKKKILG